MTNETVVIECGVAQTRAFLMRDGVIRKFWFGPARGDEHLDPAPNVDDVYVGRVLSQTKAGEGAFVNIGTGEAAFVPLRKDGFQLNDGALIQLRIAQAPREGKGPVVRALQVVGDGEVGRVSERKDAAVHAVSVLAPLAERIVVDQGAATAALTAVFPAMVVDHDNKNLVVEYTADDALETSLGSVVVLDNGSRINFQESAAAVMIDIDAGRADASSTARLRDKLNLAAARDIALEIDRRNLAGQIVIDFLKVSRKARQKFDGQLKEIFPTAEKPGWTRSGLYAFILRRGAPSLLEQATEQSGDDPVPGRRFKADWQAKTAMAALENLLRIEPAKRVTLWLGHDVKPVIDAHPQWSDRMRKRYGARFTVEGAADLDPRAFRID